MPHIVSIVFGAIFTVAVMWALGRLLFGRVGIRLHALEHDLLAFVSGGALLSFLVFLLCAANAARTWVFLAAGIVVIALNWRFGARADGSPKALAPFWKWLFGALFAGLALLYLSNSLAPEISPDGQTYHLGLVYRLFREHGFHRITTNMYSSFPLGTEMLFLFAFSLGRHSAAATVHCCYLLALPLLILSYAGRIGKSGVGVCAAILVLAGPVAGIDGISAYNDVALATTAFALFYVLEIWREKEENRLLIAAGLLAGFCVAIKLTGFVALPYAGCVILLRKKPRALIPVAATAALIAVPWFVKDWLWVGNPVSPFFNRVFPNPYIHVAFEEDYRAFFRHYELSSFLPLFRMVTVSGGPGGGEIGPVFLLAPLALIALRWPAGRTCLLAAAFFLVPYPLNIAARFLISALPFLALGVAIALEFSPHMLAVLAVVAAFLAWPSVMQKYTVKGDWHLQGIEWPAALRIVPQDKFLSEHSPGWVAAQTLDYFVPKGKRVWSSAPIAEAYCNTDVMVSFQSAEGEVIQDILTDQSPRQIDRFIFPKRLMSHLRIAQTATGADIWSIGQARVFNGNQELPRAASWLLSATPFPWNIGLAFDGNPVTRWRSWEPIHSGMHIDMDFGELIELDRIELHISRDQAGVQIHPEACDAVNCGAFPATLTQVDDQPAGDLRKLAAQTVKARGVDYLLIDDSYRVAADMRRDAARWGMEFVAERGPYRLYRIP